MQRGAGRSEGWGRLYDSGTCTCRLPSAQRFSSRFSGADLRRYSPCTRDASPASTWGLLRLPASVFLCFVTVPLWTGVREDKATGAELAAKGASSYCERHLILNARRYREKVCTVRAHHATTSTMNRIQSLMNASSSDFIYFRSHDPRPMAHGPTLF